MGYGAESESDKHDGNEEVHWWGSDKEIKFSLRNDKFSPLSWNLVHSRCRNAHTVHKYCKFGRTVTIPNYVPAQRWHHQQQIRSQSSDKGGFSNLADRLYVKVSSHAMTSKRKRGRKFSDNKSFDEFFVIAFVSHFLLSFFFGWNFLIFHLQHCSLIRFDTNAYYTTNTSTQLKPSSCLGRSSRCFSFVLDEYKD